MADKNLKKKQSASSAPDGLEDFVSVESLDQLGEQVRELLINRNLEVSKVRPFFWSMVETYVDRFQTYPFDVVKALFSYLELRDYPEVEIKSLVQQLESLTTQPRQHASRKKPRTVTELDGLDPAIRDFQDSLKYAAMVGDNNALVS